jgi:N-acyl homoserine lactone hydrolase
MKLYVLSLGFMEMDQSWIAMKPASVRHPNRPAQWVRVPLLSFLITTPTTKILFDTGCDPLGMSGHWPGVVRSLFTFTNSGEERIEQRLASIGISCEEIDVVVLSHLHYDHAGNVRLFKNARVLVHRSEMIYALLTTHIPPQEDFAYSKYDLEGDEVKWELVDEDRQIAPGVELITLEGHSPGMLGLMIHLKETGTLICPGDALYTRGNYGPPARPMGTIYDSLGFHRSVAKIRRLQTKYNARIFYPHDLQQFVEEMPKPPQFVA